jgi:pimeloyl-ACP methyl ester carboxylesterase
MVAVEAGEDLLRYLANTQFVVFEQSGHCPFLEEPDNCIAVVAPFMLELA